MFHDFSREVMEPIGGSGMPEMRSITFPEKLWNIGGGSEMLRYGITEFHKNRGGGVQELWNIAP